jgi:3-phosphoshikimate 1-carboxyvinyltransferase
VTGVGQRVRSLRLKRVFTKSCGHLGCLAMRYARSVDSECGSPSGPWSAPAAVDPVRARLRLPGSKSMTNRALVIAALAAEPTCITGALRARDTALMAVALAALGVDVREEGVAKADVDLPGTVAPAPAPAWRVTPGVPTGNTSVDVGNAGTVMRFVPPVAALTSVVTRFHGDPRASQRPVGVIIDSLREIGAVIDDAGTGAIPFTVHGTGGLVGGVLTLDASATSQFVSGLLLAAPRCDKGMEIRHRGPRAPSAPHIDMTFRMLAAAGAQVECYARAGPAAQRAGVGASTPDTWVVQPGTLRCPEIVVEPDLSNAGPFLAAALVSGGSVTIADWPRVSAQPGDQILDLFTQMGASTAAGPEGLTLTGAGRIHGVTADLADFSEISQVVTALAALAESPSVLTGIGHQRFQETDRLAALATEINALGGDVTERPDGLEVRPRPLRARRVFASYDDHRMVMAAAVLGLAVPGIRVNNAATVGKSFPGFTRMWEAMLKGTPGPGARRTLHAK